MNLQEYFDQMLIVRKLSASGVSLERIRQVRSRAMVRKLHVGLGIPAESLIREVAQTTG